MEALVGLIALAARLGVVTRHDGLRGIIGYDCGVYFAGADALIHGRLPYRDFTMVHPPGITLALVPFAGLTRWLTDWHAFIVATLAFCALGSVNAVLVVRVCRRLGFGAPASALGGLFYAGWYGSVSGEFQVKLEPLGNVFLLCGLLLLLRAQQIPSRRADLVAGLVLGCTLCVKIWWGLPVVVLVVWHAWQRRSARGAVMTAVGAVLPVVAVYTPFFLADPSRMFASVVTDQIGRSRAVGIMQRLNGLTTLPDLKKQVAYSPHAAVAVLCVALVAVLFLAWAASRTARAIVVLVAVQLAVLIAAPSWFQYYSDYVAVGLAICVGAAASSVPGTRRPRLRRLPSLGLTAAALIITSLVTITGSMAIRPFTGAAQLTGALRHVRCVTSVNTTVLLRLDTLTRGLEAGCPDWIDVTGRRYGLPGGNGPSTRRLFRDELVRYLRSGNAVVLSGVPVPHGVLAPIEKDGVLVHVGGDTVYRGRR